MGAAGPHEQADEHGSERTDGHPTLRSRRAFVQAGVATGLAGLFGASSLHALSEPLVGGASVDDGPRRGRSTRVAPILPPARLPWFPGDFVMSVDVGRRMMALTFDDGPSPYNTASVLRTLDRYGVKATFFLVGVNVLSWPDIARSIVSAGHELGNHSVYHSPYRSTSLAAQIGPNQQIIRDITGVAPTVSRAPGLTRGGSILQACAANGMWECHTHMATFDWLSPRYSAWALYEQFVRHHRNGAFPIYHDGGDRRPTPDALPSIIEYGRSIGYQFVTANELIQTGVAVPGEMFYVGGYRTPAAGSLDAPGPQPVGPASGPDRVAEVTDAVVTCNFDAAGFLRRRLDDPTVSRVERSRIVEALAAIDTAAAD